jgi:hypothetical protein
MTLQEIKEATLSDTISKESFRMLEMGEMGGEG